MQSQQLILREVAPYLAIDRHIERKKEEYYWVLAKTSNGHFKQQPTEYHINFFLQFMIKALQNALHDIPFYHTKQQFIEGLSETTLKVLNCFADEPEKRLTTSELMQKTNIARRTLINNLNYLVNNNLLQRLGKGAATRYQLCF